MEKNLTVNGTRIVVRELGANLFYYHLETDERGIFWYATGQGTIARAIEIATNAATVLK